MATPIPCEALATKAELNELKQQINELFGRLEDDETQVKDVLNEGNLEGTLFLGSFIAGVDGVVEKVKSRVNLGAPTRTNILFRNGNGKYFKSGTVDRLNKLIQANNAQATAALKNSAVNASRITGLLSFLLPVLNYTLIQVQTRKLNPLILENIDRQIATDQVNWDLTMRIFNYQRDLTEEQIGTLKTDFLDNLSTQKIINDENQLANSQLSQQIEERDVLIGVLKFQIEELKRILKEQKEENAAIADEFGLFAGEAQEQIRELEEVNFTQNARIEALEAQLDEILLQVGESELDLLSSREALTEWELLTGNKGAELENLEFDFANFDLQSASENDRETNINQTRARFTTIYDYALNSSNTPSSGGGGGLPSNARKNIVNTQNKQIELTAKLAGIDPTSLAGFPILDFQATQFSNPFGEIIDNLIPNINVGEGGEISEMDYQELSDRLSTDVTNSVATGLVALTAIANKIDLQTTSDAITSAAETAVCNTTAPGGCMTNNIRNPIEQGQNNLGNLFTNALQGIDLRQGQVILEMATNTNQFVKKAWSTTKMDKVLNVLNTILAFHNALMLSRNLGQTLGDVASQALQFLKIKDSEDNFIDVNEVVGTTIDSWITNIIGAQTYATIQQSWTSLNRIMVAAQGVVFAVQGVKNAVLEGLETVGNWTAKIGNNMMVQGLLEERSFPWMNENVNFRNPFNKFLQKIDTTEEIVGQVNNLVSSGIEAQENFNQIFEQSSEVKTASQELQDNLSAFDTEKETLEQQEILTSQSPDIDRLDLIQLEPDEIN